VLGIDGGAETGIDGGAVLGIDGGAVFGIDGGAVFGIDGGAVLGIDGGAELGIDGGAELGIDGGAVLGIDGGAELGIDGGAVLGIDGGAVLGIDGGAVLGIDGGAVLGIDGGAVLGISGGAVLSGPVESINSDNGVFESMGQVILASDETLSSLSVGDYVVVYGSVVTAGWLYADSVSISTDEYVSGATEVFVTGILSSVDPTRGIAQIGNLIIDYTSSLANLEAPSGVMWSFTGTRPVASGVMLSD
ncbi:MAG: hypothetical protein KJP16_07030, partial [Gammaproteobacteria bacterium]|nr:hypothetical protein [Gammaproteobacteria bacterium]NNL50557.1 hypothetical protein [Woeseiaceae bacterium]